MNFLRTLAVLAVLLLPVAASGDPIVVSGADVNARLEIFNNDEIIPIGCSYWARLAETAMPAG